MDMPRGGRVENRAWLGFCRLRKPWNGLMNSSRNVCFPIASITECMLAGPGDRGRAFTIDPSSRRADPLAEEFVL